MMRRLLTASSCAALALAVLAGPSEAAWTAGGTGSATAPVDTLAAGNQPTTSVSAQTVTVSFAQVWSQGNLLGTMPGGGYTIRRYAASGGAAVTPGTSCDATITGAGATLSCPEANVPPGSWQYTVAPLLYSWTGAESPKSVAISVGPPAPSLAFAAAQNPPAGQTTGAINLSWSSVATATGYNVYRRAGSGSYDFNAPLNGAVPVTGTTYTDPGSGLTGGITYSYVIRAVAAGAQSANSNEQSATAYFRAAAPTGTTATPGVSARIVVGWTAAPGAAGYNVYRRTTVGAYNYAAPLNGATPVSTSSYSDLTSVNGTSYRYVVRSVTYGVAGAQLESADSTESAVATADGTAPGATTMTNPGSPLRGTVTLAGSSSDSGSGIATLRFEYAPAGTTTWATGCTATTSPYSCGLVTTSLADGLYDLHVVATDVAGNATTSAAVTNRRVDNTAPSVSLADPGAFIRGNVTLTATAGETGSGMASLNIEGAPTGTTTWTPICASATASTSCSVNTNTYPDGGYDLRAVATDVAGNTSTTTLINRVVDNTAPTGTDIQTVNVGGGVAGKPETGDVVQYSFSEPIAPASVLAGWSGSSTPVVVRFTTGNPDVMTVFNAANATQLALGSFRTTKKYTTANVNFTASNMVLSGNTITITLGTPSGATLTAVGAATMQWTTSTAATDRAGNPVAGGTINETGGSDLDF